MSPINLITTHGDAPNATYRQALTTTTPPKGGLWYRSPESIKTALRFGDKIKLIQNIRVAMTEENIDIRKGMILNVFETLLASLQTGFTSNQVSRIIGNLSRFTSDMIVPIESIHQNDYLLNETTGPTDAFKDLALQMLTEMVAIIVEEENAISIANAKNGQRGQILKFVVTLTSTSGDTGPAGGSGIEGKDFIINVIGFPREEATYSQAGQMMRLQDNVRAIPMNQSFSAIQDAMKAGNTDKFKKAIHETIQSELGGEIEQYGFEIQVDSGSFNSINPGRIDGQTLYHSYGILKAHAKRIISKDQPILEVVPSGNGGHVFGVLMARVMTGQSGKTVITCNQNDFFYKMVEEGVIAKPKSGSAVNSASISMIIEYPNNIWRLLAYILGTDRSKEIEEIFNTGGTVNLSKEEKKRLQDHIIVKRVTQKEELTTIGETFRDTGRLVCPHTANALCGLKRYRGEYDDSDTPALISETASPWKFLAATAAGLSFEDTDDIDSLYTQYRALEKTREGCIELIGIISQKYEKYGKSFSMDLIPGNLRKIYADGFEMGEAHDPQNFHADTLVFLKEYASNLADQVRTLIEK